MFEGGAWVKHPPSPTRRAKPGKAPRPRVGSGFDRDPGCWSVCGRRFYVPSRFRRMPKYVDLGFERFVKKHGLSTQRGDSVAPVCPRRRTPRGARRTLPPLIDWSTLRARARTPPGRESDGTLAATDLTGRYGLGAPRGNGEKFRHGDPRANAPCPVMRV